MKINLNSKLLLTVLLTAGTIYMVSIFYIGFKVRNHSMENAQKTADSYARSFGNDVKSNLVGELKTAISISEMLEKADMFPTSEQKFDYTIYALQNVFKKRSEYRSIWTSWELSALNPTWQKNYGRKRIEIHNNFGKLITTIDSMNLTGDEVGSLYHTLKNNKTSAITTPYFDDYDGVKEMVASVVCPITVGGKFVGLSGIDISLNQFQAMIKDVHPYPNSTAFLVASDGIFVANQKKELVGKHIEDVFTSKGEEFTKKFSKGKQFSITIELEGSEYYVSFAPVKVTEFSPAWMVGVAVPHSDIMVEANNVFRVSLLSGIIGLLILSIIIIIISKNITRPLERATKALQHLAKGEINKAKKLDITTKDEIGDIANSTNILIDGLKSTALFASEIGKGNLEAQFSKASEEDILGQALVSMRFSLQEAKKEEEKMREAEEEQKWATAGFAQFGEILRNNTDDIEAFTFNIISNLVKYTNSNQGAMFLINDSDENYRYIEMTSCYAYDRKKFVDKKISIGEGLVGQCVLEGEMIYMTDIPDSYVRITSGLGDSNPRALAICPLKFNDKVYGVIELASFNVYKEYQLNFIEKLCESIASTISSVKINIRTIKLLEESKLKSEELAAQEEEMRQNMEELQTTQEESLRRETEMNGVLKALNASYLVIELDLNGTIITVNDNTAEFIGIPAANLEGRNLRMVMSPDEIEEFEELWQKVLSGQIVKQEKELFRNGKKIWVSESYTPIYDINDEMYKVLNMGNQISLSN